MTMTILRISTAAAALAAILGGCANYGSIAPGTGADQVRARMGTPAEVWKNGDGTETWEYPTSPNGWYTYMVDLGPDHTVRDVHQVLDDPYFAKIQPGQSRDQVRRVLGAPKDIAQYRRKNEEVWSWRYKEANNWYKLFNVAFDASSGTVLRTFRLDDPYMYDKGGRGKGG